MLRRMFVTALLAGGVAGLTAFGLQTWKVVPLIHEAEMLERSAEAHGHPGVAHEKANHDQPAVAAPAHDHGAAAWQPKDGIERTAFTLLANLLTGIGFGALLVGAVALSGREIGPREGVLWGAAGFVAFSLAPTMGLPPELPGMIAAELVARQIWWVGTAAATVGGMALLVFAPSSGLKAAGVALLALPHLIGAPHVEGGGAVPPELVARYVSVSLAMAAAFWVVLGAATGAVYRRLGSG